MLIPLKDNKKNPCVWLTIAVWMRLEKIVKYTIKLLPNYLFCLKTLTQNKKDRLQQKIHCYFYIFQRSFPSAQVIRNYLIITKKWMYDLTNRMHNDSRNLWEWEKIIKVSALALENWTKAIKLAVKVTLTRFHGLASEYFVKDCRRKQDSLLTQSRLLEI